MLKLLQYNFYSAYVVFLTLVWNIETLTEQVAMRAHLKHVCMCNRAAFNIHVCPQIHVSDWESGTIEEEKTAWGRGHEEGNIVHASEEHEKNVNIMLGEWEGREGENASKGR